MAAPAVAGRDQVVDLAFRLYAVLSGAPPSGGVPLATLPPRDREGAQGLRFNIRRGFSLRDAATLAPVRGSFAEGWRPARELGVGMVERDRLANPFVLARHLRGDYDIAIEAPAWSSFVVLDIDRPDPWAARRTRSEPPSPADHLAADQARDRVLEAVWRAYGFNSERQPVVMATPGGGYHVYLPTDRLWPGRWLREWHEIFLRRAGLELRPGQLELYPSGVPLRAPCGRGSALLVPRQPDWPDELDFERLHVHQTRRVVEKGKPPRPAEARDVCALVSGFLARMEATRRPLEAWLHAAPPAPAWDVSRFGPWGEKTDVARLGGGAPYQHIVEVQGGALRGSRGVQARPAREASGYLLYGADFRARVIALSAGLTQAGTRHDGAMKLAFNHFVVLGQGREETLSAIETWLRDRPHVSSTRVRKGLDRFVRETLGEIKKYLTRLSRQRPPGAASPAPAAAVQLGDADHELIRKLGRPDLVRELGAILTWLRGFADASGRVGAAVNLSAHRLELLCGQRRIRDDAGRMCRASGMALQVLLDAGLLSLHTNYSVGRHGRIYALWYRFGAGELPPKDAATGAQVVAVRDVAEGELVALAPGGFRPAFVELRKERATTRGGPRAWWRRMYVQRAFSPADFAAAEDVVIPGPEFRGRGGVAAVAALAAAELPHAQASNSIDKQSPGETLRSIISSIMELTWMGNSSINEPGPSSGANPNRRNEHDHS